MSADGGGSADIQTTDTPAIPQHGELCEQAGKSAENRRREVAPVVCEKQ